MYTPKVLLQDTYYPFGYILKPSRALLCAVLFVKVDIGQLLVVPINNSNQNPERSEPVSKKHIVSTCSHTHTQDHIKIIISSDSPAATLPILESIQRVYHMQVSVREGKKYSRATDKWILTSDSVEMSPRMLHSLYHQLQY